MTVAALDIGGTAIKAGIMKDGALVWQEEFPTDAKKGGEAVMRKAEEILSSMGAFDRIGISTAGQVDSLGGFLRFANDNIPGYTGMQVRQRMEDKFGVPTAVENDVNSAALGEARFGAGRGEKDFLCLTYGTGIGGGIIVNGNLYTGSSFSAGEVGHIVTHPDGLACTCGGRGCYECYGSVTALVREAQKLDPALTDGRAIFREIHRPEVQQIVDSWADEIVWGLVTLTHTLNPSAIILGGGIMQQASLVKLLGEKLYERIMPSYRHVRLKAAELGNTAGLFGAAVLALEKGFLGPF
ncbi:MAG: ROK family protein [Oscillospiraceae bacterium]|nr:ROK family protein [Oscillospiraceae bacterium]